jgi:hypothetical protein
MGCVQLGTRSPVRNCTKYYSLRDGALFTWDRTKYDALRNNTRGMDKKAILDHGKMCESGIATRFSVDLAVCISFDSVSLSNERDSSKRYVEDQVECTS